MNDFIKIVEKKIGKLSFKQQVLFIALTCEKLLPNYIEFYNRENWGDIEVMEEAMIMLYQYLQDIALNDDELDTIYEKIIDTLPDARNFDSELATYAADAGMAIADAIEYLLSEDPSYVINVASYALDMVDMFVQESENLDPTAVDMEARIAQNPYMIREVKRQSDILNKLLAAEVDLPFIASMRELNNQSGPIIDLLLVA